MDIDPFAHQLWISAALIAATTFVHGLFIAAAAAVYRSAKKGARGVFRFFRDTLAIVLLSLWLIASHFVGIAMWAGAYMHYELFETWETALYFSAASYTTLGFGDVLLDAPWRLLSGATAANGLLLFGLSAAFLFEAVGQLHLARRIGS